MLASELKSKLSKEAKVCVPEEAFCVFPTGNAISLTVQRLYYFDVIMSI